MRLPGTHLMMSALFRLFFDAVCTVGYHIPRAGYSTCAGIQYEAGMYKTPCVHLFPDFPWIMVWLKGLC